MTAQGSAFEGSRACNSSEASNEHACPASRPRASGTVDYIATTCHAIAGTRIDCFCK